VPIAKANVLIHCVCPFEVIHPTFWISIQSSNRDF
jgi:hypothetical protein